MHVCPCRYQMHTWAFADRGQRLASVLFFSGSSFETGSSLNLGFTELVSLAAVSCRDPPVSASLVLGLQACIFRSTLLHNAGGLSVGPHAYVASSLPTDPSP